MRFGVAIKSSFIAGEPLEARGQQLRRMAMAAEGLGYESIWVPDRTVFPEDIAALYPQFGPVGQIPDSQQVLEPLVSMSFLAGSTGTIKLGFNVVILPFRNPVLNAKMIATLDVLSGGRVIFGVGVGWMPEEFEAMGASWEDRGTVTDEHIEMFKALCADGVAEYQGKHFQTSGKIFYPKPLQRPHPPIWVGGKSRIALRRVARLGHGWLPIGNTPAEIAKGGKYLREQCEVLGRDPDTVELGLNISPAFGEPQMSPEGERVPLTGDTEQVRDDVRRYQKAGLDFMLLSTTRMDAGPAIEALRQFADEVAPEFSE